MDRINMSSVNWGINGREFPFVVFWIMTVYWNWIPTFWRYIAALLYPDEFESLTFVRLYDPPRYWNANSDILAQCCNSPDAEFLERLNICLPFHNPWFFIHHWHQKFILAESVMPHAPTRLLTSEVAVLVDTQSLLFLWSAGQLFISASRSGHFTMCVCFFFSCIIFWAGGGPKSLPTALSPCCFHIYLLLIWNLW